MEPGRCCWLFGLLFLAGCATVDLHYREPNWPADMRVTEHRLPPADMHARCDKYGAWWETVRACSEWNLPARTCDIYITADQSPEDIAHEREHCAGHTRHKGEGAAAAGPNWPLIIFLLI